MEQKYIYSFSQIEDKVKTLHETNTEAAAAVALSWLGLSRDELKTLRVSDYNSTMRMLHSAGRVVYVREDLIADMLKAICEEAPEYSMGFFITDVNSAYAVAEKQELSPISVLKMRYFYEKHSAKLSGEPEDRVFLKEILRSVGESEADMEKQFAEYEKDAPEKIYTIANAQIHRLYVGGQRPRRPVHLLTHLFVIIHKTAFKAVFFMS